MGNLIVIERLSKPTETLKVGRIMRINTNALIPFSTTTLRIRQDEDGKSFLCQKINDKEIDLIAVKDDGILLTSKLFYHYLSLYAEKAGALYLC